MDERERLGAGELLEEETSEVMRRQYPETGIAENLKLLADFVADAGHLENSPAIYGWDLSHKTNQVPPGTAEIRGVRIFLSSLTGLVMFPNREPSAEALGYFQTPNSVCSPCFFLDAGAFLKVSSRLAALVGRSMPLPSINSFTVRSCRRGYFCRLVLCS